VTDAGDVRARLLQAGLGIIGVGAETPRKMQGGGLRRPPPCLFRLRECALAFLGFRHAPLVPDRMSAYLGKRGRWIFVTQRFEPKIREPIFNVPLVVIATVVVLLLVHVLRMFALTDEQDLQFLLTFAFIPARYGSGLAVGVLPGGFGADLWTLLTYAFLHADLMHLGLNLAWLLPFGTALARRFGVWRYILFMLVISAAGALAHLVSHLGALEPMIGASAAISGAMAAAMRFVFQQGGPLAAFREGADEAYRVPAVPLGTTLRDPRFLLFLAVWLGLNALFGLGTVSFGEGAGQEIAWQAHVGGFFAGLFLFDAFDPIVPRAALDTEANG
jgi:membrane associated rhomboid family serine protease